MTLFQATNQDKPNVSGSPVFYVFGMAGDDDLPEQYISAANKPGAARQYLQEYPNADWVVAIGDPFDKTDIYEWQRR